MPVKQGLAGAGMERRIQSASLSVCLTGLQDLNTQQHSLAKMQGQFNSSGEPETRGPAL